jgi:hypothetical protein
MMRLRRQINKRRRKKKSLKVNHWADAGKCFKNTFEFAPLLSNSNRFTVRLNNEVTHEKTGGPYFMLFIGFAMLRAAIQYLVFRRPGRYQL